MGHPLRDNFLRAYFHRAVGLRHTQSDQPELVVSSRRVNGQFVARSSETVASPAASHVGCMSQYSTPQSRNTAGPRRA